MTPQNKVALVTGSSRGIGKAIALKLAKDGFDVAINFKGSYQESQEVLSEVLKYGVKAITVGADVSKTDEAERLVKTIVKELGGLDVLVNNVGKYFDGDEWDGTPQAWEDTFKANVTSTLNVSKFALEYFLQNKKGNIINISSRFSISGRYDAIAYAAAKEGILNITKSYAKLLLPFGRSNCISPGIVKTGYWAQRAPEDEIKSALSETPMGRFIEPDEIAELVSYLASDKSVMMTGQNIVIDGGFSIK